MIVCELTKWYNLGIIGLAVFLSRRMLYGYPQMDGTLVILHIWGLDWLEIFELQIHHQLGLVL